MMHSKVTFLCVLFVVTTQTAMGDDPQSQYGFGQHAKHFNKDDQLGSTLNQQIFGNNHQHQGIHHTYVNHHVPPHNHLEQHGNNHHNHQGLENHQDQHSKRVLKRKPFYLKKIKEETKAYLDHKDKLLQRLIGKRLHFHHHHHHFHTANGSQHPTPEHHHGYALNHQNHEIHQVYHPHHQHDQHHQHHHHQHDLQNQHVVSNHQIYHPHHQHDQHNNQHHHHQHDLQNHHNNRHVVNNHHHHHHQQQQNTPPEVLSEKPKEDINVHDVFSRIAQNSIGIP